MTAGKATEAVLFLTHVWDETVYARFVQLMRSISPHRDGYLLLDESRQTVSRNWRNGLERAGLLDALIPFTATGLERSLGYDCQRKGSLVPGSAHYPVIEFWKHHCDKRYQHYWVVEFDVLWTGDWHQLFGAFESRPADVLLSHLTNYRLDPSWHWWSSLCPPPSHDADIQTLPQEAPKGFFPIYRISDAALHMIDAAHMAGWLGHMEVLLPYIVTTGGLIVKDFNEYGRYYVQGAIGPNDGSPPYASLRWRPNIDRSEMLVNEPTIFHPIKTEQQQSSLNRRGLRRVAAKFARLIDRLFPSFKRKS